MNDDGQAPLRDLRQLALVEEAFDQQDAARVVLLAQRHRHVELEQREAVGFVERRQHAQQAMPVGVRLHDGEQLRPRRALARQRDVRARAPRDSPARKGGVPCARV